MDYLLMWLMGCATGLMIALAGSFVFLGGDE